MPVKKDYITWQVLTHLLKLKNATGVDLNSTLDSRAEDRHKDKGVAYKCRKQIKQLWQHENTSLNIKGVTYVIVAPMNVADKQEQI